LATDKIRAVIFDVGGVLIRTEDPRPRAELERRLGLAPGEAEELVFNGDMGTRAQLGEIRTAELWRWVQQRLGLDDAGLEEFRRAFFGGDRLDVELVDYVRALRPRRQTAIISNAMDSLRTQLATDDPAADAFDLIVCSAEERVMKPDAAIYERTLARLGIEPDEAVFIDDAAKNIAGARAVGMHALHYMPGMDVPAELARLGVNAPARE
jgi:epoxide hydrolase-like predicted phosphatase